MTLVKPPVPARFAMSFPDHGWEGSCWEIAFMARQPSRRLAAGVGGGSVQSVHGSQRTVECGLAAWKGGIHFDRLSKMGDGLVQKAQTRAPTQRRLQQFLPALDVDNLCLAQGSGKPRWLQQRVLLKSGLIALWKGVPGVQNEDPAISEIEFGCLPAQPSVMLPVYPFSNRTGRGLQ
jgi:hypothetical protein